MPQVHHHPSTYNKDFGKPDENVKSASKEDSMVTTGSNCGGRERWAMTGDTERERGIETGAVEEKAGWYGRLYMKHVVRAVILSLFTGWWIAGLYWHRLDKNWVVPFIIWCSIAVRIATFYVPARLAMKPIQFFWKNSANRAVKLVPQKLRTPAAAFAVAAIYAGGAFASEETAQNTRIDRLISCIGLLVFILLLWLTSRNRSAIRWHTVIVGMLMQFVIALFVLRTQVGYRIFKFVSQLAVDLLHFANVGSTFIFGKEIASFPFFFFSVLPAIIFFVALVQMLYFYHILQWLVEKFAIFFSWSMQVSGAEAVVAAASPFIGQGESAMLVKPFVPHLTMAELHQIMCSGFATIAGSVLVAYLGMGINPQALISSCVMSIPASLAVSKLRYPETEEPLTAGSVTIPVNDEEAPANGLHAFANGAWLGLKIGGMIVATQLCIISCIALIDGLLTWWGGYFNISGLTLEMMLGYLLYPVSFLLGVSRTGGDLYKVAQLIGIKLVANEFVAYNLLVTDATYKTLSDRSVLIATYALCGFANIGSLGTQIGVLSQIAPSRAGDVSRLAVSALLSGALSTMTSALVAGMVVTDMRNVNR